MKAKAHSLLALLRPLPMEIEEAAEAARPIRNRRSGRPRVNFAPGEGHPRAVLTEEKVRAIRQRHADGESCPSLAREYGIARNTVWCVVTRQRWTHI